MKKFQNIFMKDPSKRKLRLFIFDYDIYQCFFWGFYILKLFCFSSYHWFLLKSLTATFVHIYSKPSKIPSKKNKKIICFDPTVQIQLSLRFFFVIHIHIHTFCSKHWLIRSIFILLLYIFNIGQKNHCLKNSIEYFFFLKIKTCNQKK